VKQRYGGNAYRLEAEGDLDRVADLDGVESTVIQDGSVKILLRPDVDGGEVLHDLVEFLKVSEFHSEEPSLEEIFIRSVQDAQ
jgi:ABC-type uncharacterized transport system ATPase subunit